MSEPTIRTKPGLSGPWCWQEKEARRKIRERMNGESKTVYVLSVYDALTEIASDEETETFKTSHPYLATKAGCGVTQLKVALQELKEAGLILIETPKLRGPCSFTLLVVSRIATSDSHDTPSVSRKTFSDGATTVEEKKKKETEEKRNKAASAIASLPLPFTSDEFRSALADWQEHLRQKRKPLTLKSAEAQLKRCSEVGEVRAIAMLRHSTECNYQGLFEPSGSSPKPKRSKPEYRSAI
jgi:hypothetical protein